MTADLAAARARLTAGGFTCVLCRGEAVHTATARGVRPLLEWLDNGVVLTGFSAADKVVGRGAAFLYVLLGVQAVWAPVMSRAARDTLACHGIEALCEELVEAIVNRTGDGFCPMETAVRDIDDPTRALAAIRETARRLAGGHN